MVFLRCFTTFYSGVIVYSYLRYVELSRGADLGELFYDVLTIFTTFYPFHKYPLTFVMLNCLEGRTLTHCFMSFLRCFTMFLRRFTMFYSVLIVDSYPCYVELSRGTDLEALFYGVLTMLYSVSFVYSYTCYAELSGGTDLQAFKK